MPLCLADLCEERIAALVDLDLIPLQRDGLDWRILFVRVAHARMRRYIVDGW